MPNVECGIQNYLFMFRVKKIIFCAILLLQAALLYFNLLYWQSVWFGWILFFVYFLSFGALWQNIFKKVFGMARRDIITKLLAWLALFLLLGLLSSIFTVWYKITPLTVWFVYAAAGALSAALFLLIGKSEKIVNEDSAGKIKIAALKTIFFKRNIIYIFFFLLLWAAAFYLLYKQSSGAGLDSPWQAIDKYYIIVFFLLTFLLGVIVFSRHKVKLILGLIILHSLLLHFYLPASHILPWGGDVWRHIGVEQKLLDGEFYPPVLFGPEAKWREMAKIDLPEAFIILNKYAYGQLWGTSVFLSNALGFNLLAINKWLIPILWGVFMPLIFFRLGRILFGSWRAGLILSAAASIPFSFQALGGLTLPVSLGYLTFFFTLTLWFQYLCDQNVWQKRIATLFALLMLFGYSLHFILIWLVILLSCLFKLCSAGNNIFSFSAKELWLKYILGAGSVILLVLFFPLIELLSKVSRLPVNPDWFGQIKQLAGQFSGWFFAGGIRPHDTLSGNIIFNHTPGWAFVSNLFTVWRWHIMPIMIMIWLLVFGGLYFSRQAKVRLPWIVLRCLFAAAVGGYLVSWFILEGDRSLVRRLDGLAAFLILVFLFSALASIWKNNRLEKLIKPAVLFLVLIFSWLECTAYASGPDMRVVSVNEYNAADYIFNRIDLKENNHCVLADTWILLVLEGLSNQEIVGGGFPITYQFAQVERTSLYQEIQNSDSEDILVRMHNLTNSSHCFAVLPYQAVNEAKQKFMRSLMGADGNLAGGFVVWEETPKAISE